MNLVFNSKNLITAFLTSGLLLSPMVNAIECGVVEVISNPDQDSRLRIIEVNDQFIWPKVARARKTKIKLNAGQHVLHITEEPSKLPSHKSRKRYTKTKEDRNANFANKLNGFIKQLKHHSVAINVKADKYYTIVASTSKRRLVLDSIETKQCDGKVNHQATVTEVKLSLADLSKATQKQFGALSEKAADMYPEELNGNKGQFMEFNTYNYFGLVSNSSYGDSGGIKVLSVQPQSSAFKIGLRKSDEILTVAGVEIIKGETPPSQQINTLVEKIKDFSDIAFKVIRDEKVMTIQGKKVPLLVPASWFTITDDENPVSFTSSLVNKDENQQSFQLEYDALILALVGYVKENNINMDRIVIDAPKRRKTTYGLSGHVVDNKGLKVSEITPSSIFTNIGLKTGDIITQILGSEKALVSAEEFAAHFDQLANGQTFQLMIERNGKKETLAGRYKHQYYPAMTLNLNMSILDETGLLYREKRAMLQLYYLAALYKNVRLREPINKWAKQAQERFRQSNRGRN